MLEVQLEENQGIAFLEPVGKLAENDFKVASKIIDSYLEKHEKLQGLIIHVRFFPGWDSFSSLVGHLKFVKAHHKRISRVAFVTDSPVGSIAEKVARHFVRAEVKSFAFDEIAASKKWIMGSEI